MLSILTGYEKNISFPVLNYATRLLASETDIHRLVQIALDTIADFGHSKLVKFFSIDSEGNYAKLLGKLENAQYSKDSCRVLLSESEYIQAVQTKQPYVIAQSNGTNHEILPLLGSGNKTIGFIVFELSEKNPLGNLENQIIIILSTLISISLEHTRYYKLAMYDGLTGLFVRREFDNKLSDEISRIKRYEGFLSIFMVDIDHFKLFNDTYGHQQGDNILREMSKLLKLTIRHDEDIACRYGGEELVVILPNTDIKDAEEIAERFRDNCEHFHWSGLDKKTKVTVSIGVATMSSKNLISSEQLIKNADIMLYKAKDSGRNKVLSFT